MNRCYNRHDKQIKLDPSINQHCYQLLFNNDYFWNWIKHYLKSIPVGKWFHETLLKVFFANNSRLPDKLDDLRRCSVIWGIGPPLDADLVRNEVLYPRFPVHKDKNQGKYLINEVWVDTHDTISQLDIIQVNRARIGFESHTQSNFCMDGRIDRSERVFCSIQYITLKKQRLIIAREGYSGYK